MLLNEQQAIEAKTEIGGEVMEKEEIVRPVKVTLFCDECGEEMKPTGKVLTSDPAQYPHTCKNGHTVSTMRVYPFVRYKMMDEPVIA